jgi:hypothetical protein
LGTDETGPEKSGSVRLDIIAAVGRTIDPRRVDYLSGFVRRRSALAIRNTAPPGNGIL